MTCWGFKPYSPAIYKRFLFYPNLSDKRYQQLKVQKLLEVFGAKIWSFGKNALSLQYPNFLLNFIGIFG